MLLIFPEMETESREKTAQKFSENIGLKVIKTNLELSVQKQKSSMTENDTLIKQQKELKEDKDNESIESILKDDEVYLERLSDNM